MRTGRRVCVGRCAGQVEYDFDEAAMLRLEPVRPGKGIARVGRPHQARGTSTEFCERLSPTGGAGSGQSGSVPPGTRTMHAAPRHPAGFRRLHPRRGLTSRRARIRPTGACAVCAEKLRQVGSIGTRRSRHRRGEHRFSKAMIRRHRRMPMMADHDGLQVASAFTPGRGATAKLRSAPQRRPPQRRRRARGTRSGLPSKPCGPTQLLNCYLG